ncbi:MAG: rhodanese-like domain-containing protein [Acidimicrobiales bacterium]|jgi:rhodanese-related sulfurtransferase|nr:rhodanese-like domain-containing protein [Acidimicrobiales bacterium]
MGWFSRLRGSEGSSDLDVDDAREVLRNGGLLVDVRERNEWDAGHAPKAKHYPLRTLPSSIERLPADRTLVVVCRSGNRSKRATRLLRKEGLDARNLRGGMTAWRAAGQPLVNSRGRTGTVA